MTSDHVENFWDNLVKDIQRHRITLPSLPEVALKARNLLDSKAVTAKKVAKVISSDAVLTAQLLRIVNSPLYRSRTQIDDIQTAITRLGNANVRRLVTSVVMEQLYQPKLSGEIRNRLAKTWKHSVHVAALCHIISRDYLVLKADEALLAGLIHDIGTLPILEYADITHTLEFETEMLDEIVIQLHPRVGNLILKKWQFSDELIAVVTEHETLDRDIQIDPDYTDIVIVANLLSYIGTDHPYTKLDWTNIPAFSKLALTADESIAAMKNAKEEITEIQKLFFH